MRISESGGEVSSTQKVGKFFGVDFVVFDFAAVDRFEVKCVTEDEWDLSFATGVGEPVPVEGGFTTDDQFLTEGFDLFKEVVSAASFEVAMQMLSLIHI